MSLPIPPVSEEKWLYANQDKTLLYSFGIISMLTLVSGMVLFSLTHKYFYAYLLFALVTLFYLGLSYFIGVFGGGFNKMKHWYVKNSFSGPYPSVDVFLPSCGEDLVVIRNTFKYVRKLYYEGSIKVFVLDDCKDIHHNTALENMAVEFGFEYIYRENKGELKKSGNVRHAFAQTSGELILILDADFAPSADFLCETVPYMDNKKVAIVQTPQFFEITEDQTWVQKGAAYIQELFYRLIQVNRNKWGASICVGTCALYRRSALAPHGGTAAIGFSEDVHTGFQAILDGYKIVYLPINLSKGLCPDTVSAFLTQQYRWATGSITLFSNPKFWKSKLPLIVKLNYLSGMLYYLTTGIGLLLTPIPGLVILSFFPEKVFYYNIIFSLPSLLYGTVMIPLWTKAPWGFYAITTRTLTFYAHLGAIVDKVRSSSIPWVATGAVGKKSSLYIRFKRFFFAWGIASTVLPLTLSIYRLCTFGEFYHFIPSILIGLFNLSIFSFIGYILIKE